MHSLITGFQNRALRSNSVLKTQHRLKVVLKNNSKEGISRKLEDRVYHQLVNLNVTDDTTILLCISGGSDSMALLHIMQAIKKIRLPNLALKVVNFNHKQRVESDEEAIFVKEWSDKYQIECLLRTLPENLQAERFTQDSARDWRRNECQSLIEDMMTTTDSSSASSSSSTVELPSSSSPSSSSSTTATVSDVSAVLSPRQYLIATAHHQDDQMETLLLKVLRGAHISRLQPMLPRDGHYIRPFLSFSKEELTHYLTTNDYPWREDASNQSRDYKRNKVRLDLLPLLTELCGGKPALTKRLSALAAQSTQVKKLIQPIMSDLLPRLTFLRFAGYYSIIFEKDDLAYLPTLVLHQILHQWVLSTINISLEYLKLSEIGEIFKKTGSKAMMATNKREIRTINDRWDVCRFDNELRLVERAVEIRTNKTSSSSSSTSFVSPQETKKTMLVHEASQTTVEITHPVFIQIRQRLPYRNSSSSSSSSNVGDNDVTSPPSTSNAENSSKIAFMQRVLANNTEVADSDTQSEDNHNQQAISTATATRNDENTMTDKQSIHYTYPSQHFKLKVMKGSKQACQIRLPQPGDKLGFNRQPLASLFVNDRIPMNERDRSLLFTHKILVSKEKAMAATGANNKTPKKKEEEPSSIQVEQAEQEGQEEVVEVEEVFAIAGLRTGFKYAANYSKTVFASKDSVAFNLDIDIVM